MKALVTIIILLIIGLAAWLLMRGDDTAELGDNPAAAVQAIQEEADENIDLGEFQDKG